MRDLHSHDHCSDEQLLSHMDGETSGRTCEAILRHLQTCWACRARQTELEEQTHRVTQLAASSLLAGTLDVAAAKDRFSAWRVGYERTRSGRPTFFRGWFLIRRWPLAVAATLVVCLAAWVAFDHSKVLPPTAGDTLARVVNVEHAVAASPSAIHQVFRVEMEQSRPAKEKASGRLEVWSDISQSRYASRWTNDQGSLRFASWQPEAGRRFVYDQGAPALVAPVLSSQATLDSELELQEYDLQRLEKAFMSWMRRRDWQPVSMSSDFAVFASRDGVRLVRERIRGEDGKWIFKFTAEKTGRRVKVTFVLDVEADSLRPRMQTIRFETSDRSAELRLASVGTEVAHPGRFPSTVYGAPADAASTNPALVLPRPTDSTSIPSRTPPALSGLASAGVEIEVWYALHRAHACLQEVVKVEHGPDQRLSLHGMAATEERRLQLISTLSGLANQPDLTIDIGVGLPVQRKGHVLPMGVPANPAVQGGDAVYLEALALVRLAERFPPAQTQELGERQRALLAQMVEEHAQALDASSRATGRLLKLDLRPNGAEAASPAPTRAAERHARDWSSACFLVFRTVDQMDELIQTLASEAGAPLRVKSAASLAALFQQLDSSLSALHELTSSQLASRPEAHRD